MEKHEKVKNNKFKISAATWNERFELPDGSYSVSDINDYFEYIIKKYEAMTDNLQIRIYEIRLKNEVTFRIKTEYYLKFITLETFKLLG